LNREVTVPQLQNTHANPYGQIIANRPHSWFTSSKWASERRTVFSPPAVRVRWRGNKQ
jgi:hypothetical protein